MIDAYLLKYKNRKNRSQDVEMTIEISRKVAQRVRERAKELGMTEGDVLLAYIDWGLAEAAAGRFVPPKSAYPRKKKGKQ